MPLPDAQWARIEPLLPGRAPKQGGRWRDHHEVSDVIAFKFQTGTQWVHLPEKYSSRRGPELGRVDGLHDRARSPARGGGRPPALTKSRSICSHRGRR
ncbi:transposase [Streptomyces pinistramenti]|uniref:transposase n=1 Tax=Streptomyces pinistramenti TaxID=2884812 RepID=UPI001D0692D0|nr:transposase [Streptomyces pinistramenti]